MESFLTPHLRDEAAVMYGSIARLQERWPAELALPQSEVVSIYDCHPWLFIEAFPPTSDEKVRILSLAVRLFASSLMVTNPLSALMTNSAYRNIAHSRARTWLFEACQYLHQIFPPGTEFWTSTSNLVTDYEQAVIDEQRFITGKANWHAYREMAYTIATKGNGIGRISIIGLAELSQHQEPLEMLTRSLDDVSFAVRMLADSRNWRKQLQNGIPSLLLTEMLNDKAPPLDDAAAMSILTAQLEAEMHRRSSLRNVLIEALRALDRAAEVLASFPSIGWRRVIEMYRRNCLAALETAPEIVSHSEAPAVVLNRGTAPSDSIPEFAWRGTQMLLREWSEGLREATHIMPFPHSQGFISADQEQAGDVFQRALILDVFCDLNERLNGQLSNIIADAVQSLLDRRRTTGVGGWSYFPDLRELPADADDLAQVMQTFLRSGRSDAVSEYCERPLSVLLTDNINPNGSFETWIIPSERDAELELQARWVQSAWGSGPDCEVIANLLYALWLYDSNRFSEIIDRGTRYVVSCQQPDGSCKGSWYHGPFYGTWVCLRLLASAEPDSPAIVKGREFLLSQQHPDGGWGDTKSSDPLSTALALLGLAATENGVRDGQEMAVAGLQWLQQTQAHDGGWQAVPFIKMELGRATGRPWQTLTYQSRTISTAFAIKAALAWSPVTNRV